MPGISSHVTHALDRVARRWRSRGRLVVLAIAASFLALMAAMAPAASACCQRRCQRPCGDGRIGGTH
jgi:hypothetical protein